MRPDTMIDFTMPGHLAPVPQTWKQGRIQSSPLEPQQKADCDENKLRLVREPGKSYGDVILRLASDAKP
jgi:hypothetical protein